MKAGWQALQVMWTLHNEQASGQKSSKLYTFKIGDERYDTDVYEPHVKYRGTIAIVHGMSPFGKEDKRIVMFCQALCHIGFRVIAPDVQEIRRLEINARQIDSISKILSLIADNKSFCPSGRLSIMAPSFSGAMCLAAAAKPVLSDKVMSVCAIGAFTHVESVLDYLLTEQEADPYGRYIVLKKIIPLVMEQQLEDNCEAIQRALDAAISDNINETTQVELEFKAPAGSNLELEKCLRTMSVSERALVNRIFQDATFRRELFVSAKQKMANELEQLDIVRRLDQLSARVLLLHGRSDRVIPYSQSELLHAKLCSLKKESDLVITPFISHGDTRFSLRMVLDVFKIVKGFSLFFEEAVRA